MIFILSNGYRVLFKHARCRICGFPLHLGDVVVSIGEGLKLLFHVSCYRKKFGSLVTPL